jgi:hypothetical protein
MPLRDQHVTVGVLFWWGCGPSSGFGGRVGVADDEMFTCASLEGTYAIPIIGRGVDPWLASVSRMSPETGRSRRIRS